MSQKSIIQFGHPTLRKIAHVVSDSEFDSPKIRELIKDLRDTLPKNGIGLASVQINVPKRVFIANINKVDWDDEINKVIVCINPEIITSSKEESEDWEGCLSAPGWWGKVTRPDKVEVRYVNESGEVIKSSLSGVGARVFQHELDHLNGVLFTDRMPKGKKLISDEEFDKLKESGQARQ